MADIVDSSTRSRMMAGIRGSDTRPEISVRRKLHGRGFRFRLHSRNLPGKPDIVLPRHHAVLFVHGCFWHGHDCRLFKMPQTRTEFWQAKISRNRMNDSKVRDALLTSGWRVGTVWECSLNAKQLDETIERIADWIRSDETTLEVRG